MHDEFERAYTGRPKKGLSPLAWVLMAFGGLVAIGLVALTLVGLFVARQVERTIDDMEHTLARVGDELEWEFKLDGAHDLSTAKRIAESLVALNPDLEVVGSDDAAGVLELLDAAEGGVSSVSYQDVITGHLTIDSDEGTVRFDLRGDEDGGSFVISGDDGDVFSMKLQTEEDGGRLVIETEHGTSYFQAGEHAVDLPGWVPLYPEARSEQGVFSARTGDGSGGAIVVETRDRPEEVIEFYAERFEREGFEPRLSGNLSAGDDFEASLTGHASDNRFVGVFVGMQNGVTRVLLTWGQEG